MTYDQRIAIGPFPGGRIEINPQGFTQQRLVASAVNVALMKHAVFPFPSLHEV